MLSALAASAAITALTAGVAGAWSPCGFSMVDTIGTALGDARRLITLLACAMFTVGAVAGGALTFGGLAFAGELIGPHPGGVREALGVGVAAAAAIADWRGVRIAPQIRRQVPEHWRWRMPLPLACALYGLLLGLGFTTFVLAFAVWALAGISFALGSPMLGLLIGLGFGVGRALPILWMAPGVRGGAGARRLEQMAAEPRLWLGLRRLDALGLSLCAVLLGASNASAAVLHGASDPSAAGGELGWQAVGGPGMLRLQSGQSSVLPGAYPALGGSSIAWRTPGQVTVLDRVSMAVRASFPAADPNALAVSDGWLVYREQRADGSESLVGISLLDPTHPSTLLASARVGEIGRPALDGATVVFALATPRRSRIEARNLTNGVRRVLRSSDHGTLLSNPSLLRGRLLYERSDRCIQELRIGNAIDARHDRLLLRLASTVSRDPGYQSGYEHAYNGASLCPNRGPGRGGKARLGSTALGAVVAYVTEILPPPGDAHIITLSR
jgi:hypothetical protein